MMKNLLYMSMIGLMFLLTACPNEESIEPYAYFMPSATTVHVDELITFDNQSEDAESFGWNFGDGNISKEYSPVHSYDEEGEYEVILIVYNKSKSDQYVVLITVLPNEQPVKACFTMSTNSPEKGQAVSFTNCSENANSYSWDFGDGGSSTASNPSYIFNEPGNYTVSLTAYGDSGSDEYQQNVTVRNEGEEPVFDPYDYNSMPTGGWNPHYYTDFSDPASEDWEQETEGLLTKQIIDGKYVIENFDTEYGYLFWTNAAQMPSVSENFDIDVYIQIEYDDSLYGVGTLWGIDISTYEYYYYQYTHFEGAVWYTYGDYYETWTPDFWQEGGNLGDYNKLSIRKYENKYYLFMNEVFIDEHVFDGYYGNYFGFVVGMRSKMLVEEYGIHTMIFSSRKSASQKTKVPTQNNNSGWGQTKYKPKTRIK